MSWKLESRSGPPTFGELLKSCRPRSWNANGAKRLCEKGRNSSTSHTTLSSCATTTTSSPSGIAAPRNSMDGQRTKRSGGFLITLRRRSSRHRLEEINAELNSTGRWEGELIHTRRDGTQVVVASRWALQLDERGKPIAILETNNDITESKRAEEALHKAQAELAHVTRVATLGEMTASISHEVNQPLSAVITNANASLRWLTRQSPDLDEARAAVERIIRDSSRASEVIGRIRALVKKSLPRQDWLNINDAVLEVIALARSEMNMNCVSLQTQLADNLPAVRADRIQLQQVILNLLINGIEAMNRSNEGSRELGVSTERDGSSGVLIAIRDSGVGLNPENLEHLFDPFYTTKPDGMGMGLAISRSIIEAHGGLLWATPNTPCGAVFQFTLPHDSERES